MERIISFSLGNIWRWSDSQDRSKLIRYLKTLDISHAYLRSKYETARLIREFGSRLSQIHLSGTYRRKSHQSLQSVSRDFLQTIEDIKHLEVPLVIEEDFKVKSIAGVKEELTFIRGLFNDAILKAEAGAVHYE